MPDVWVILPVIVSAAVIILLYTVPPPWVSKYLRALGDIDLQAMTAPQALGETLRSAYPPADVAGMVDAVITSQRPHIMSFLTDEGIPMLAAIGSGEVAKNARGGKSRLASAVGDLGAGAAGLQGLAALVAKPGKSSGLGDLMQYLPMLQGFMQSQSAAVPDNGAEEPPRIPAHLRSSAEVPYPGPPV